MLPLAVDLVENGTLLFGPGAQFMLMAAYAAASQANNDTVMEVVMKPPYYASYPDFVRLMKGYVKWRDYDEVAAKAASGNDSDVDWNSLIEVVTSPNNPDGFLRNETLPKARYHFHDNVYLWPHTVDEAINSRETGDVVMFGSSKLFGVAGDPSRFRSLSLSLPWIL